MKTNEMQTLCDNLTYELQTQAAWSGHEYAFDYAPLSSAKEYAKEQTGEKWKAISEQFDKIDMDIETILDMHITNRGSAVLVDLFQFQMPEGSDNLRTAAMQMLENQFLDLVNEVVSGLNEQIEKSKSLGRNERERN